MLPNRIRRFGSGRRRTEGAHKGQRIDPLPRIWRAAEDAAIYTSWIDVKILISRDAEILKRQI